ncbi:MAG: hypothetical protein HYW22_02970 [Candidatus Aenigmarchaeota archaeon]|nr:hypothetical protein [Candidatus Aenigmarchaeota archaeon]
MSDSLKIILGIILPITFIVLLVFLSSSSTGFSVETSVAGGVNKISLSAPYGSYPSDVSVEKIKITNNNTLPKTYTLPSFLACLRDTENRVLPTSLQVVTVTSKTPVKNTDYSYGTKTLEIGSNSLETVDVRVKPYQYYDTINDIVFLRFATFNELILLNYTDNSYYYCDTLSTEQIDNAFHIPLTIG